MIKIDVEGHEEAVLQGALETIRGNRPSLIIESEDRHNPGAPQRVFAFLRGLDYDGYFIKGGALHSLDKLAAHDWAFSPQAMVTRQYINNFIFIARERQDIVDQVAKGVGP